MIHFLSSNKNKKHHKLIRNSSQFIAEPVHSDKYIWALGIELEATYVLNPLDTDVPWDKSFKTMKSLNIEQVIKYADKLNKQENKKIYPDLDEGEKSGRQCRGMWVLKSNPYENSMTVVDSTFVATVK